MQAGITAPVAEETEEEVEMTLEEELAALM